MQYRAFGKLGFEVSALGMGCMRLPLNEPAPGERPDPGNVNEAEAIRLIRHAIDQGINYVDTAYNYHKKLSEAIVGKALKDGYREKVKLATKLPGWLAKTYEDFDKLLTEQLEKLDTDYIDLYLVHALNREYWTTVKELGLLKFLDEARASGRVKHIGFSFHDGLDTFKEIIDAYDWEFCQIQLNFLDEYNQAGVEGLHYAAAKGLPVVIMEPLRGGNLAKEQPAEVQNIWAEAPVKRTPADWALRWVWNFPEVTTVLSGMSTFEQVDENVQTAEQAEPNSFSAAELAIFDRVKEVYRRLTKVNCTACGYCMTCPNKVLINEIFSFYNDAFMFNELPRWARVYNSMKEAKRDASVCVECGHCETVCPQHLPIIQYLKEADRAFTQEA